MTNFSHVYNSMLSPMVPLTPLNMEEVLGLQDTYLDLAGTRRGSNPVECLLLWGQGKPEERSLKGGGLKSHVMANCIQSIGQFIPRGRRKVIQAKFSRVQAVYNRKDKLLFHRGI